MKNNVIEISGVNKSYQMGLTTVYALRNANLIVERGEFVSIMGPSGSGKSTLMNIIGLLDHPDTGTYKMEDIEVSTLNDDERSHLRNKTIGFIFQNFNLIPRATALRNVILPLTYRSIPNEERVSLAGIALGRVGLSERTDHQSSQLSGGECQRVAIARALVGNPSVILADEPTGNLDSKTGSEIMRILTDLSKSGQTVIMVTHDRHLAALSDRIIRMKDGYMRIDE